MLDSLYHLLWFQTFNRTSMELKLLTEDYELEIDIGF